MANMYLCTNCFEQLPLGSSVCIHCGFDNSQVDNAKSHGLPLGYTLFYNRFTLGRVIGAGGFGIVYSAYDNVEHKRCAIKEYFPADIAVRDKNGITVFPAKNPQIYNRGIEKFKEEINLTLHLSDCKHSVNVLGGFNDNGTAYFAMEFVEGKTLKQLAANQPSKCLPYTDAMDNLQKSIDALREIHNKGVIHRDVSPENLIRLNNGRIKLIDFGASKYINYIEPEGEYPILLKPNYAPPEQYDVKGNQGVWTDIYSLAATFYVLMSGVKVPTKDERLNNTVLRPLSGLLSNIPSNVSDAISKALEMDPRCRFQSVDEFQHAMENKTVPVDPTPPHSWKSMINWGRLRNKLSGHVVSVGIELWLNGSKVKSMQLKNDVPFVIGRSPNNSLYIDDNRISREHCTLLFSLQDECILIKDTSTNGTMVVSSDRSYFKRLFSSEDRFDKDVELWLSGLEEIAIKVVLK